MITSSGYQERKRKKKKREKKKKKNANGLSPKQICDGFHITSVKKEKKEEKKRGREKKKRGGCELLPLFLQQYSGLPCYSKREKKKGGKGGKGRKKKGGETDVLGLQTPYAAREGRGKKRKKEKGVCCHVSPLTWIHTG